MFKALLALCCLFGAYCAFTFFTLPNVKMLEGCITTSMYKVNLCPTSNHYVKLRDVSQHMIDVLIASEDASFYSHNGFDWYELKQSMSQNLKTGEIHRGGSTLTQQLAKNVFLSKEKSYWRKLKEAYLTYSLEKNFSKNQILEKYLNVVEFGPNLYGIRDAANHYFHKPPSQLNPLESCYLAFLLPNPKVYSKSFRQGQLTPFAKKMVSILLHRLVAFHKLDQAGFDFAHGQIGAFPWSGISNADFENPSGAAFGTETTGTEEVIDEEALEKLLKDELKGQAQEDDIYE